jgi:hypothetical protein
MRGQRGFRLGLGQEKQERIRTVRQPQVERRQRSGPATGKTAMFGEVR